MYWLIKLKRLMNLEKKARLPERFSSEAAGEDIRRILAENQAIHGDAAILDQFIKHGEILYYRRGQPLILQGEQDNDVFFLLAGSVDINFKNQLGSIREAPNQVGELAATKPGAARSATVIARTDEVAALRVSGSIFHSIYVSDGSFRQRLEIEKEARFRERIAAGHVVRQNASHFWFLTALASALVVACIVWFATYSLPWTQTTHIIGTLTASVLSFLTILVLNPVYFWRRCFWVSFVSMFGTLWFGRYVSIQFSEGFQMVFGAHTEGGSGVDAAIEALPFLAVMLICAIRDRAVTQSA